MSISLRQIAIKIFPASMLEYLAGRFLYAKRSFSQFGEDVHIRAYYERLSHDRGIRVSAGWIVDVGAFRPIIHSNTYWFFRSGWHCINIDPTPGTMDLFRAIRASDVNLEIAISSDEGEADFFCFGRPSVWNTMDRDSARYAEQVTGLTPQIVKVKRVALKTALERHLPDPAAFEILCIDAEGFDIEILLSNDFAIYRPRVILIEVNRIKAIDIFEHPTFNFLTGHGYELYSWINPNLMFIRSDSVLDSGTKI